MGAEEEGINPPPLPGPAGRSVCVRWELPLRPQAPSSLALPSCEPRPSSSGHPREANSSSQAQDFGPKVGMLKDGKAPGKAFTGSHIASGVGALAHPSTWWVSSPQALPRAQPARAAQGAAGLRGGSSSQNHRINVLGWEGPLEVT